MRILVFICITLVICPLHGQEILRYEDFEKQVLAFHPVAFQEQARVNQSSAQILTARSAFEPILNFENSQKTLDNKSKFNYNLTEIVYQSPYAVKFKAGYESSNGSLINPESSNGRFGFLGIEVPLLQGLLTDYKRTALRQSQFLLQQSQEYQRAALNDLILESSLAYWKWGTQYKQLTVIEEYATNAVGRFRLVKLGFVQGDRSMADTLDAYAQLKKIEQILLENRLEYVKNKIELSKFLWNSERQPYLLAENIFPDLVGLAGLYPKNLSADFLDKIELNHPEVLAYRTKQKGLQVTSKLYSQFFLPELTLKANLLNQRNLSPDVIYAQPVNENYKFGINFRFPLFIRDARSKRDEIKWKLNENQSVIDLKIWELKNKVLAYGSEVDNYNRLFDNQNTLTNTYQELLKNENFKFTQGETNLFIVNSRENTFLENVDKLYKTQFKLIEKSYYQRWAAGVLY
ncbi:MAG: TolC family protein [Leadbetterella sp.]